MTPNPTAAQTRFEDSLAGLRGAGKLLDGMERGLVEVDAENYRRLAHAAITLMGEVGDTEEGVAIIRRYESLRGLVEALDCHQEAAELIQRVKAH